MLFRICLFITTIIYLQFTFATTNNSADELSKKLNALHSLQADFIQITYDNHGREVQKSYGQIAFMRPGKFRWDVTKPIPQLIIANQSKLWIYDRDLAQVTIRSLTNAASETPGLLLSHNNIMLGSDYIVATSLTKSSEQIFTLKPRRADSMFASIELGFMSNEIHEMQLKDHLGHTTVIRFMHIHINPALPTSLFTFKANGQVDVIDETHKKQ